MSSPSSSDSAQRAQRDADDMGVTEDEEHAAADEFDRTGEPERDALGNQEGAS